MRLHDTSRSKFRSFTQPQSNFCTALYKQLANDLLLWKSFAHYFKQSESTMKQTIRVPKQTIWNNLDLGFLDSNHLAETICETNNLGSKNPPLETNSEAKIVLENCIEIQFWFSDIFSNFPSVGKLNTIFKINIFLQNKYPGHWSQIGYLVTELVTGHPILPTIHSLTAQRTFLSELSPGNLVLAHCAA